MNIPIFVISLKESTTRREEMTKRLSALNLNFRFFDAVDGRGFDVTQQPVYDRATRLRYFGRDLTSGEIGCLLSHKGVYQKIVDEHLPGALVLEDDVILHQDFPEVLKAVVDSPVPYDVVRFLNEKKIEKRGYRKISPLPHHFWLVRLKSSPGGGFCTYIRRSGAQKLLRHLDKTPFPVDTWFGRGWQTGIDALCVQPGGLALVDWDAGSLIGAQRFDKAVKLSGIGKLRFLINRFVFKSLEGVGKRYIYWINYHKDAQF